MTPSVLGPTTRSRRLRCESSVARSSARAEAGRDHDGRARSAPGELANQCRHRLCARRDDGEVGRLRQRRHARISAPAEDGATARIDGEHVTCETRAREVLEQNTTDRPLALARADHGE
jgi:hypothetical protein